MHTYCVCTISFSWTWQNAERVDKIDLLGLYSHAIDFCNLREFIQVEIRIINVKYFHTRNSNRQEIHLYIFEQELIVYNFRRRSCAWLRNISLLKFIDSRGQGKKLRLVYLLARNRKNTICNEIQSNFV